MNIINHIKSTNPHAGTSRDAFLAVDFSGYEFPEKPQLVDLSGLTVYAHNKRDVARYAKFIRQGSLPPAVVLSDTGEILDGAHRIEAAKLAGLKQIPAFVGVRKNPSSRFKALPIGTIFHTGKSYGVGASAKIAYWLEWRKDDKSHAVCVNQIGYGNDRAVGTRNPFAPNAVVFEVDGLQKNPTNKYKTGLCDAYAIALHKLYGYPIYVVNGLWWDSDSDEWAPEPSHMVVKKGTKYIDVDGEKTRAKLLSECMFTMPVEKIKIQPVSESEAKWVFTMEGVSDDQINDAVKFIENPSVNIAEIFAKLAKKSKKLGGGNCGMVAYAMYRFLLESYGVKTNIGLISDTDEPDWLREGEPDIYHVFIEHDGRMYDETGEIDNKYLSDLAIDQYDDKYASITIFEMPDEEKAILKIIRNETNWDVEWRDFLEKLEKLDKTVKKNPDKIRIRRGNREHKRFWMLGREYKCPKCGWVPVNAASNNDKKRNIVCECDDVIIAVPKLKKNPTIPQLTIELARNMIDNGNILYPDALDEIYEKLGKTGKYHNDTQFCYDICKSHEDLMEEKLLQTEKSGHIRVVTTIGLRIQNYKTQIHGVVNAILDHGVMPQPDSTGKYSESPNVVFACVDIPAGPGRRLYNESYPWITADIPYDELPIFTKFDAERGVLRHGSVVTLHGIRKDRIIALNGLPIKYWTESLAKNPSFRSEIQRLKRDQQEIAEDCNFCINRMQEQGDLAARCDKHNAIFHKQWQKLGVE